MHKQIDRPIARLIKDLEERGMLDRTLVIFTAMGISPKTEFDIESRPFYATKDGLGKSVRDVFA